jgi:hypothetical protein
VQGSVHHDLFCLFLEGLAHEMKFAEDGPGCMYCGTKENRPLMSVIEILSQVQVIHNERTVVGRMRVVHTDCYRKATNGEAVGAKP